LGFSQEQTVGLLSYKKHLASEGYTLFFPRNQSTVFLINNCGEIMHQWEDNEIYVPNNAVYLLEDGSLVKCKKNFTGFTGTEGAGFFVEIRSWENDLIWSYQSQTPQERLHHDIEVLPNGNILMIAWEIKSGEDAIANGRLEEYLSTGVLFPDYIFEINPVTNEKVWEWHVWDHLIQDVDDSKLNFGVVSDHPELVDINYVENTGTQDWDWLHVNAIDYHEGLDQIMLCVPYFNEIWIIDHSTTTAEAAGHQGGLSGKGGDILYRVGNPQSYKRGDENDKILFFPHDTHWANKFIEPDHPNYNDILVFNNKIQEDVSTMEIFDNPWDEISASYPLVDEVYEPTMFENSITHPTPTEFYSRGLSGVQVLPNGNILGCSGGQGYFMELSPDNEIVWEYKVPMRNGARVPQGTQVNYWENLTFRAFKYPLGYAAFEGRDLSIKGHVELDPNISYCDSLTSNKNILELEIKMFPNPVNSELNIKWSSSQVKSIEVYNLLGIKLESLKPSGHSIVINTEGFPSGIYLVSLNGENYSQFIKY